MKNWYLCYFSPTSAREIPNAGPQKYLNRLGNNVNNVAQFLYRENPKDFLKILRNIQTKLPGIKEIRPVKLQNGQLVLEFLEQGFDKPFYSQKISDGTLKLFAYYLLLYEKDARPLVFIEEPENGLYHKYLADLALEMKNSIKSTYSKQLFVTTHSPFFVNSLSPDEIWVLEKQVHGFSTITRASEYPMAKRQLLQKYSQNSIIGTWECLANIVYEGGLQALKRNASSYYEIGKFKCECARNIGLLLDIRKNASPSFNYFIGKLDSFYESGM